MLQRQLRGALLRRLELDPHEAIAHFTGDAHHARVGTQIGARVGVPGRHRGGHLRGQRAGERPVGGFHDGDRAARLARGGGELGADPARADDHDVVLPGEHGPQPLGVVQGAQQMHARHALGAREHDGFGAGGEDQDVVRDRSGERLLVHHWDNALQGPRTVAANIIGEATGELPAVYDPVPYFWSEQFGRFVQYAGHHTSADTTLWRGDPSGPAWSVCWLRENRLVALLAVGRPRDLAQGRRLIEAGTAMDAELLADPARPLKSATA